MKILKVKDNIQMNTINDICELFKAPLKKRGFLYPGATIHPTKTNVIIWWPAVEERQGWNNIVNNDYSQIIERHTDEIKQAEHVRLVTNNPRELRYVFLFDKHQKGRPTYKFIGEFKLDMNQTSANNGLVWIRTATQVAI